MKVLVFGCEGALCNALVSRLGKERHEVYLVSQKKWSRHNTAVFQTYQFAYASSSIAYILENVRADAVVFMGAADTLYAEDGPAAPTAILGDLGNVLAAVQQAPPMQFCFVSTLTVFEETAGKNVDERALPAPATPRSMAFYQAERLCENYLSGVSGVLVARLGEVYGTFGRQSHTEGFLRRVGVAAASEAPLEIHPTRTHPLLHIGDAVEGLYTLLRVGGEGCYHIAGETATEAGVVSAWNEVATVPLEVEERQTDKPAHRFSGKKMAALEFAPRHTFTEELPALVRAARNKAAGAGPRKNGTKGKSFWRTARPFLDNLLFFAVTMAICWLTRGFGFHNAIDLFLWYTLLIVVVHDLDQGILAMVLSAAGKVALLYSNGTLGAAFTGFSFYLWAIQLIALTLIVAFVKQKYGAMVQDMREENTALLRERQQLKQIHSDNTQVKHAYEDRLVHYQNSLANVSDIVAALDRMESSMVIFQAVKVIGKLMDSADVAIYTRNGSHFYRLMAASSPLAASLGKTLESGPDNAMFTRLHEGGVWANRGLQPGYPTMAAGVSGDEGIDVVVMLWTGDLGQTTLYHTNMLSALCSMVGRSLTRAWGYMEMLRADQYIGATGVMKWDAFRNMLRVYQGGAEDNMLEFTLLNLTSDGLDDKARRTAIVPLVRNTDYVGEDENGTIYVLLTNFAMGDLPLVRKRFETRGFAVAGVQDHHSQQLYKLTGGLAT